MKTVEQMSLSELEAALKEKQTAWNEQLKKAREAYENNRNAMVIGLTEKAKLLSASIEAFSVATKEAMKAAQKNLEEYGMLRGNSKGGFKIESADGLYRIVYQYKSIFDYDERADKAEALLKDFMKDVIKKKDIDLYEILMTMLERNAAGRLEYSRVQEMYKHENKFTDPRWKEALKLFKESFTKTGSKMSTYFYERDENGTYQAIPLNFSSL